MRHCETTRKNDSRNALCALRLCRKPKNRKFFAKKLPQNQSLMQISDFSQKQQIEQKKKYLCKKKVMFKQRFEIIDNYTMVMHYSEKFSFTIKFFMRRMDAYLARDYHTATKGMVNAVAFVEKEKIEKYYSVSRVLDLLHEAIRYYRHRFMIRRDGTVELYSDEYILEREKKRAEMIQQGKNGGIDGTVFEPRKFPRSGKFKLIEKNKTVMWGLK